MINKWQYGEIFLIKFAAFTLALHIIHGAFLQYLVGIWFDAILISCTGVILLFSLFRRAKIVINKGLIGWICMGLIATLSLTLYEYKNLITVLTFVFFIFVMLFSENQPKFIDYFLKYAVWMALISAISALVFYIYPSLYTLIFSIYGGFVANTDGGNFGYRAGITPHTSWQGIICSIGVLYDGCILIIDRKEMSKKTKILRMIRIVIFFSALLLSAKRGPTVFVIMSLLFIYVFISRSRIGWKILLFLSGGIILYFSYEYMIAVIPGLEYMISRFIRTKDISSYRFQMWKLALEEFRNHSLFGIGWLQYRYIFSKRLFAHLNFRNNFLYTDAHNVYIQILCETGLVGFCIYMTTIIMTFFKSLRQVQYLVKENNAKYQKETIMACFGIQLFFLIYSLSGNPLYDLTFSFYAVSCGMAYYIGEIK